MHITVCLPTFWVCPWNLTAQSGKLELFIRNYYKIRNFKLKKLVIIEMLMLGLFQRYLWMYSFTEDVSLYKLVDF